MLQKILVAGTWRSAEATAGFHATNPADDTRLPEEYPVSAWADCDAALAAAAEVAPALRDSTGAQRGRFLRCFADRIERCADGLCAMAHAESGLPMKPRLANVELPRTTDQLRQAATAAEEGSWALPTIDTLRNIRSMLAPLGPVWVFGPNNFPFAFNSVGGGDFAAAIAAGNPVIAKANTSHPGTSRLLAEEAVAALYEAGLPPAAVQLLYRLAHADGERLAADPRTAALAYTGSRNAGLKLKAAADAAGKPVYLELSSINPVLILPGALAERRAAIVEEYTASCLLGSGQFCTSPSVIILFEGESATAFIQEVADRFAATPPAPLLSRSVQTALGDSVRTLLAAGAGLVTGGTAAPGSRISFTNTLLRVTGERFLAAPAALQTEAFGNAALAVVVRDVPETAAVIRTLEGNLTGTIYSARDGTDDSAYDHVAPLLRARVGRLLNDKMPTGVAVSPAMNHGGPFPATGHPGFTAVGIPASLRRFGMLQCYDGVRPQRLPAALADSNPDGRLWRYIDGVWTQGDAILPNDTVSVRA